MNSSGCCDNIVSWLIYCDNNFEMIWSQCNFQSIFSLAHLTTLCIKRTVSHINTVLKSSQSLSSLWCKQNVTARTRPICRCQLPPLSFIPTCSQKTLNKNLMAVDCTGLHENQTMVIKLSTKLSLIMGNRKRLLQLCRRFTRVLVSWNTKGTWKSFKDLCYD